MKNIFKILDKNYIKKLFEKKKEIYFPLQKKKEIVEIEIKKESPDWAENSCLARYLIKFSDSTSKAIRAAAHVDGSKKRSFKILNSLYQKSLTKNFFKIPRPLDYLEEVKAILYEEIEGIPLSLLLEKRKPKSIEKIFKNIAQFLFSLHSTKERQLRVKMFGISEYQEIFWQIKKILPEFSNLIPSRKKIDFLRKLKTPLTFLHGDFYPSNIIIKGNEIALIDFDKAGLGSFYVDLLSFIYWFELPKIKPLKISKKEIEKLREIFLKKYCQLGKLNFLKTKKELEKLKIKVFLDCLHYVTVLAYHGWKKINLKLKEEFRESVNLLLNKIRECI